jgi:hypothetical protein
MAAVYDMWYMYVSHVEEIEWTRKRRPVTRPGHESKDNIKRELNK